MRESLPADRERALAVVADGWGRKPTTAHPLCLCNRLPLGPHPVRHEWVPRGGVGIPDSLVWRACEIRKRYSPEDCPMHRRTAPTDEETTDG